MQLQTLHQMGQSLELSTSAIKPSTHDEGIPNKGCSPATRAATPGEGLFLSVSLLVPLLGSNSHLPQCIKRPFKPLISRTEKTLMLHIGNKIVHLFNRRRRKDRKSDGSGGTPFGTGAAPRALVQRRLGEFGMPQIDALGACIAAATA